MEKTIEKLKKHHRNVKIAHATGSAVNSIAITGVRLVPATGGVLSLGLLVGGMALAVAGGGTAVGASIADVFLQHFNVERVQDQLAYDYQLLDEISQTAKAIKNEIDGAQQRCPGVGAREFAAVFGEVFTQGIA
jgi:hypothetical protein